MLNAIGAKNSKIQFEVVDPESGDADLYAIKKTAQSIRERMKKINAADQWVALGGDLAGLKARLVRDAGGCRVGGRAQPGDNKRIGWKKAFELGILPFQRPHASKLIAIHNLLSVPQGTLHNYPSQFQALYALTTKFRDKKLIQKLVDEERITAISTAADILNLAHDLGLISKRVKAGVDANSAKGTRVNAVLKLMQRLNIRVSDLRKE